MGLEALGCTNCGSTDIQEASHGKYFCGHCETVFKYVDPGRAGSGHQFCVCGNAIAFRCNYCDGGLCAGCEASGAEDRDALLPTEGFGYQLRRGKGFRYADWIEGSSPKYPAWVEVDSSSRKLLKPGNDWTTTVIPAYKLWGALGKRKVVHHVCWPCLADCVPRVAEAVIEGLACSDPFCRDAGVARCRCCDVTFCAAGIVTSDDSGIDLVVHTGWHGAGQRPDITVVMPALVFAVPWPTDVCWACATEALDELLEWTGLTYPSLGKVRRGRRHTRDTNRPEFLVPGVAPAPIEYSKYSRLERRRLVKQWQRYQDSIDQVIPTVGPLVDALSRRWESLQFSGLCRRPSGLVHRTCQDCNHGGICAHPYANATIEYRVEPGKSTGEARVRPSAIHQR